QLVIWFGGKRYHSRFGKVNNGDIVIVGSPENPKKTLNKRILGMEGDNVTYLVDPQNSEKCELLRCQRDIFGSKEITYASQEDSRQFSLVPYSLLQSKVFCRIWPISGFGSLGQEV
ncbi:hypothetical protein MKX01_023879, partial [Papaver californicum]